MSWDAYLIVTVDGNEITVGDWNYTHNCNGMMSTALEEAGHSLESHWLIGHMGKSWFKVLDGMTGVDGAMLLKEIITRMEAEPKRFEVMNPDNGWGSYERVLVVLKEMLKASNQFPSAKWNVSG